MKMQKIRFKIIKIFQCIMVGIFLSIGFSVHAGTVTFPWSESFNCSEYVAPNYYTFTPSCSPTTALDITSHSHTYPLFPSLLSAADHTGDGGVGYRLYNSDGANISSSSLGIDFAQTKEMWIRFYMRYQYGFAWTNDITNPITDYMNNDKILYYKTNEGSVGIFEYAWADAMRAVGSSATDNAIFSVPTGWETIMGSKTSDGAWHCYEFHYKIDTDGTDGVAQIWVDGRYLGGTTSINWSNNIEIIKEGFTGVTLQSNQRDPNNSEAFYIDMDDFVAYDGNNPPSNFDASGNPMIGPIGWINIIDTTPPITPSGLAVS